MIRRTIHHARQGARGLRLALAGLTIASAMSMGCTPQYETIEVRRLGGHIDAKVSEDEFSVPEGGVVAFEAEPVSDPGRSDYEEFDELDLRSTDETVARIVPGVRAESWLILGVAQGRTEVEVRINGAIEDRIPVVVTQQAELAP